ncbi:Nucleoside-diphosphate-sugar epimerase [Lachnospiraceae bacterium KHCPX20]|nr:Nucleoside-diphosphate-sugar epimerase [Lachnospiraceae bacterium KHCPX20]
MVKNIIVTGATSMIGVALIEAAINVGVNVYAIVRPNTTRIERLPKSEKVRVIKAELKDLSKVHIAEKCDVLYHFAWDGTVKGKRDDPILNEKNITYTFEAVELAYRTGCSKFVGAGSQAEYGPVSDRINVETKFSPNLSYGVSKYAAGVLSKKICEKYEIVHIWGRIFSVYGRWNNKGSLLDYAISNFIRGENAYFSSGEQKWNFLYEKDAGEIFLRMGQKIRESKEIIVASNETRPLREFLELTANTLKCIELCHFASEDCGETYGIDPDVTETERILGKINFCSFRSGIRMVIEQYKT